MFIPKFGHFKNLLPGLVTGIFFIKEGKFFYYKLVFLILLEKLFYFLIFYFIRSIN